MKNLYLGDIENTDSSGYMDNLVPEELVFKEEHFEYDFNNGFRIKFYDENRYYLIIKDKNTNYTYFSGIIEPKLDTIYSYCKKYYIEYKISVHEVYYSVPHPYPLKTIYFNIDYQDVLIYVSGSKEACSLGDGISWLQASFLFKKYHFKANIYIVTQHEDLNEIVRDFVTDVTFLSYEEAKERSFYATYLHGCFFHDTNKNYSPVDYHYQNLIEMGCSVLNVRKFPYHHQPIIDFHYNVIKPKRHYVCLSCHASGIFKEWIPMRHEYEELVDILKSYNYDVFVIDKEKYNTANNLIETSIPKNAIDMTGHISLKERAKFISGADFFIGCSSGLSWLAWVCQIPVILISGFTNPLTEFYTPYRIINYTKCNSCWNDTSYTQEVLEIPCPRKKNVYGEDYLECSTSISIYHILNMIYQIPQFIDYTGYRCINEN